MFEVIHPGPENGDGSPKLDPQVGVNPDEQAGTPELQDINPLEQNGVPNPPEEDEEPPLEVLAQIPAPPLQLIPLLHPASSENAMQHGD